MGWRASRGLKRVLGTYSMFCVAALCAAGCTGHAGSGTTSSSAAAPSTGSGTTSSSAVAPSTAAAMGLPGAGAASFCQSLVADKRLQDLPRVLRAAMVGGGDQGQVAVAVAALRQYAAEGLGQPALDVATDLAAVAKDPASDTAVNSFAAATRRLDQAMEGKCHTS